MSRRLDALLEGMDVQLRGDPATAISELCYHSQAVKPGALFVALRGTQSDGHRFIPQAIAAGAAAIVAEDVPETCSVASAQVSDSRAALAELSSRYFDAPARQMTLIGVTGTNGKTSTVRMLESILQQAGLEAGSIGTISVRFAGHEEPARLTTPESLDLQRTLARMREAHVKAVALEASSHSLAQQRLRTLRFQVGVYTNLSQDHLDYHADMDAYADAKAKLFGPEYLAGSAVLNQADALTPRLADLAASHGRPVVRFARGSNPEADYCSTGEQIDLAGSRWTVQSDEGPQSIELPLPGDFQIENALAAVAAARALQLDWSAIRSGLAGCPAIPGRLERAAPGEPVVLVDYAHTPDALNAVLARVRPQVRGRLICVFGCGGDRDRSKRVPMAQAACHHSDHVLATSDNPRTEDPDAILADVRRGLSGSFEVVVDRREAIRRAIALAEPQDTVVIAGKGHEDYQILGHERHPFDDRVEARAALRERGQA